MRIRTFKYCVTMLLTFVVPNCAVPNNVRPSTTPQLNHHPSTRFHQTNSTAHVTQVPRGQMGRPGFRFRGGGGGSIEPSGRTTPKKGSIDRTPKILQRLTPGPRR